MNHTECSATPIPLIVKSISPQPVQCHLLAFGVEATKQQIGRSFCPPRFHCKVQSLKTVFIIIPGFQKKNILSLLGGFCTLTYSLSCGLQGIVDIVSKPVISTLLQIMPVNNHFVVHALCHHVYKIENFDTTFCWLPSLTTTF